MNQDDLPELNECVELNLDDILLVEPDSPPHSSNLEQAFQHLRRARDHLRQVVDHLIFS